MLRRWQRSWLYADGAWLSHAQERPRAAEQLADPQIGRSFQIPYRLTDTNHFLVRVRLNGKGPFNFLVDSGAPSLYIATETAKKIGLEARSGRILDAHRSTRI